MRKNIEPCSDTVLEEPTWCKFLSKFQQSKPLTQQTDADPTKGFLLPQPTSTPSSFCYHQKLFQPCNILSNTTFHLLTNLLSSQLTLDLPLFLSFPATKSIPLLMLKGPDYGNDTSPLNAITLARTSISTWLT